MICCGVLFLGFALFRVSWLMLRGRSPRKVPFPPVARRPVPGDAGPRLAPAARPAAAQAGSNTAALLQFAAVGVALYGVAIFVMIVVGVAQVRVPEMWVWLVRDAAFGAAALIAWRLAHRLGGAPRQTRRERLGCALTGAGAVWFALGLVDMHVFAMFEIAHSDLVADAVFHNIGFAAVLVGAAAMLRPSIRQAVKRPR